MYKINLHEEMSGIAGITSVIAEFTSIADVDNHFKSDCVGAQFGLNGDNLNIGAEVEAWERLHLFTSDCQNLHQGEIETYDINKCILYTPEQESGSNFLYARRLELGKLTLASSARNGIPVLLPRHYIYPRHNHNKNLTLDGWTTNGGAGHTSVKNAVSSGIFELLERDSVMCSWASQTNTYKIELNQIKDNPRMQKILHSLNNSNLELNLFAIVSDIGIVTVVAALISKSPPFLSFGTSCKIDIFKSLEHAIFEAVMIRKTQLGLLSEKVDIAKLRGLRRHIMSPVENRPGVSDWLFTLKTIEIDKLALSHPSNVDEALGRVYDKFDVFYKLVATQKTSSLGTVYVVKCAMPQLHPLEVSTEIAHQDFRRIQQFSSAKKCSKGDLLKHPYG